MKKAFKEWAFNLFTKRITIKVSKLPNNAKIEFLLNKLMNELLEQGYDIRGTGEKSEFFNVFCYNDQPQISSNAMDSPLTFKRQKNI